MLNPIPAMPRLKLVLCLARDLEFPQSNAKALTRIDQFDDPPRDDEIDGVATPAGESNLTPCEVRLPHQLGSRLLQQLAKSGLPDATFSITVRASRCEHGNDMPVLRFGVGDAPAGSAEFEVVSVDFDDQVSYPSREKERRPKCRLTDRETEVLTWVGRGKTSSEIATILGVSTRTIDFHCAQAMGRLDVMNRAQAVAKAVAGGLITT
jgi:DNA-binding CsgD family transcriptional regulator